MLMNCPECELQVSDKATSCPHCGYPIQPITSINKSRKKTNKRRRLPNGFGQISEIKNRNLRNPFRVLITIGKTETGKPICKPLKPESYFPTYNDAYAALVAYNKNPYDLTPEITVKELYEKWTKEHFKTLSSETSIRNIEAAWHYCETIYNMKVSDVRARHVKGCMEEGVAIVRGKKQQASAIRKNHIKSIFNMMLDYALEYEIVDRNYARSFTLSDEVAKEFSTVKKGHIAFSDKEINSLWEHVNENQYIDVLLIQCYSGWRPQELGLIELENIDLNEWVFTGGMKTEAGTNRTVPIHSKIQPLVKKRYNESKSIGSKYLFTIFDDQNDKKILPLSYNRYKNIFIKIRDKFMLDLDHRPHDGRVHFVTMAKRYGVDEYAIKYIVGHRISDFTEKVYTKRDVTWLKEEIEKIKL